MLAGGSWWWLGSKGGSTPPRTTQAAPPTDAVSGNVSTGGTGSSNALPALPVAAPATPTVSVTTAATPAPAEAVAFTVLGALQDIVARGNPALSVSVLADKSSLTIGKDLLRFRVKSSESGYLYVFSGGTDKSHFWLLFPNRLDGNNRIEAGREIVLPRSAWEIESSGPPGTNHIVALVSRHARDLDAPGLLRTSDMIPEFDLTVAQQHWARRDGGAGGISPFIGKARCNAPPCDEAYGAKLLEITEVDGPKRGNR